MHSDRKSVRVDYMRTALVAIDVQNDFCPAYRGKDGKERPSGALAVRNGGGVIAPLNKLMEMFSKNGGKVLASQDWHPADHVSFAASHPGKKINDAVSLSVSAEAAAAFKERYPDLRDSLPAVIQQNLWPVHCVQDTDGAAFHGDFTAEYVDRVFRKGAHKDIDSYSIFFENDRCTETELHGCLKQFPVDTLVIGGLATDYCVFYSVLDSIRLGYTTLVLSDAVAGVNFPEGSVDSAVRAMKSAGAVFVSSADLA